MTINALLKAALAYAARGWYVHPCGPRSKTPLLKDWPNVATPDTTTIEEWWTEWPNANIGIACGPSELVVVDVDIKDGKPGRESWYNILAEHGWEIGDTVTSETPTHGTPAPGLHLVYGANGHHEIRNSVGKLGPGLDVRANGGYFVAPPSVHPNGEAYSWALNSSPDDLSPLPLPEPLVRLLTTIVQTPAEPIDNVIPNHERNTTLTSLAGSMRRRGMKEDEIGAALLVVNAKRCQPPLPESEVLGIAKGITRYEPEAADDKPDLGVLFEEAKSAEGEERASLLTRLFAAVAPLAVAQATLWAKRAKDVGLCNLGDFKAGVKECQRQIANAARERKRAKVEPPIAGLTIVVTNKQLSEIADEVVSALATANNPPFLFTKATNPTRLITDENGRPVAQQLRMAAWQGVVDRAAIFQKINAQGDVLNAFPSDAIVKAAMTRPPSELPFPPLLAIVQTPVVRPDGSLLLQAGYDSSTRLFYAPGTGLDMPPIPDHPSPQQVQRAFKLLREPIAEFPFVAEADAANALALLLTPLVRPMLPHGVPMALLDKPERGTGASLLAEVVALLATGHPAPMMKAPEYEEEWDKRITAMLLEGRTLVVIDNVDAPLQSQALSMALTSDVYSGRRLGYSQQIALPHRIIWVATGNNITFKDSDMPRRCYRVRLDAGMAQPWLHRKGFRHPELKNWLSKYRGRILCAALAIVRAWIQSGKPLAPNTPVIGSYEDWCETLGGILKFVGQEGFLGNLDALYEEDTGRSEWDRWLEALRETFGERRFTMTEVAAQLSPSVGKLLDVLPTDLTETRRRGGSFTKSLGRAFSRHKGHATVSGLMQLRGSKARSGWHWYIIKQEDRQKQKVFDFWKEKQ